MMQKRGAFMIRDFSFLNYMLDDDREMPEEIIRGLLGTWLINAKLYYEYGEFQYFVYRFENTKAGVLIKTRVVGENRLAFEDYQPIVFSPEPIKCKFLGIDEETEKCTLLVNDNCLVAVTMDSMGFKENDEVYVHMNLFASRIELRDNEEDYLNHLEKTEDGSFNIFNIGLGELIPPIGMIKGEKEHYPNITDQMISNFDDSFMVGSGTINDYYMIEPKLKMDKETDLPNNELPLGKCDCAEIKTKIGIIPIVIEPEILSRHLQDEKIEKFELKPESVMKAFGYIGAFIDAEKTEEME